MIQSWFNLIKSTDLTNSVIVCDGNSLTAGQGGTPYPAQLALLEPFVSNGSTITNKGVGAQTTLDMIADAATDIDPLYDSSVTSILPAWEVRNHLVVDTPTNTVAYDKFVEYCLARMNVGWKVVVLTILPSWTYGYREDNTVAGYEQLDADRLQINTWIRANYRDFGNVLCDVASISGLSDLGDNEQAGYTFSSTRPTASANGLFVDGTHLSTAGYALIAAEVKKSILKL
jgi:lysophospholipase L1-like esterase